ncbi:hypothetical protein FACS189492_1970 [Clostridia bacterium]|nr:hypothetical protein FACS189492_1970 [Clostridia bacterium]
MYQDLKYNFFTTNEIKPSGWLKRQLRIQADGLCGNLDKVWKDIYDSGWLGGGSESWERVPYWLDGFIPLAYLLEDQNMIRRAEIYVDTIISRAGNGGWIFPGKERDSYDLWGVFCVLKAVKVYGDCSKDKRALTAVTEGLRYLNSLINGMVLKNWGAARWFECLIPIFWVYEKTGEEWLITLAKKLWSQGVDWRKVFENDFLELYTEGWDYFSHVVNIAMMFKSEALLSRITGIDPNDFAEMAAEYLDRHHSMACGHFTGDENLSGNSPIQGTELCGIVEMMYSCEWLFAVTGKTLWLDRLEKLAFNAYPAATSPDMWSHQYVQMTNQVACYPMTKQPFRTNNRYAHIFGLEPNFGCCTANFGQGWPKLALASFMRTKDGIASCALVPACVECEIKDTKVKCSMETDYPFRNVLTYTVIAESPIEFTFSIRIPALVKSASIGGQLVACGGFFDITKNWSGTETIEVIFEFETEIIRRPENMVCVWRGPLLYTMAIREKWEKVEYTLAGVERKYPYCDWYVHPQSKWNYALVDTKFDVREHEFSAAFDPLAPPISMVAQMVQIEWGFDNGYCDKYPTNIESLGTIEKVRLIPYGSSNLRLTEFPLTKGKKYEP